MKLSTKLLLIAVLIFLSKVSASLLKARSEEERCYGSYSNFKDYKQNDNCRNIAEVDSSKFAEIKETKIEEYYKCLHSLEYVEMNGKAQKINQVCTKKNRFDGTYSYENKALSTNQEDYLNSSKYAGRIKLTGNEYIYNHDAQPSKGFIAATNAPIGDYKESKELVKNDPAYPSCSKKEYSKKVKKENGVWVVNENEGRIHDELCVSGVLDENEAFKKENTIHQFYKTLKKTKVKFVVMLTNFVEDLAITKPGDVCKCKVKADPYFSLKNGVFSIKDPTRNHDTGSTVSTVVLDDYKAEFFGKANYEKGDVRELTFKEKGSDSTHKIIHIHFRGWIDFAIPKDDDEAALIHLIKKIKKLIDASSENNVIVHCTGGIGRTGTFISSVLGLDVKPSAGKNFHIPKFILELRKQRPDFVETKEQLQFIVDNILKKNAARKLK
jgi:protein tyrosine phosphatase